MALPKEGVVLLDAGDVRAPPKGTLRSGRVVHALAFSPDGKTLAAATAWAVDLWDVAAGEMSQTLRGHRGVVWSVAYSADGRVLISGGKDGSARVWDARTGSLIEAYDWQLGGVNAVAVSPDGSLAAACGERRGVVVWDLN